MSFDGELCRLSSRRRLEYKKGPGWAGLSPDNAEMILDQIVINMHAHTVNICVGNIFQKPSLRNHLPL